MIKLYHTAIKDSWKEGFGFLNRHKAAGIYDDMKNISIQAYNLKKENNQNIFEAITPISGTYQTAKLRAEQEFLRIYNTQIKARIFKKYGIKI